MDLLGSSDDNSPILCVSIVCRVSDFIKGGPVIGNCGMAWGILRSFACVKLDKTGIFTAEF